MILLFIHSGRRLQQLRHVHVRWRDGCERHAYVVPVRDALHAIPATPKRPGWRQRRSTDERDPGGEFLGLGRALPPGARLPGPTQEEQAQEVEGTHGSPGPDGRTHVLANAFVVDGGQEKIARGLDDVSLGVSAKVATGPGVLSPVHKVDQPRARRVQARGQQGRVEALGSAQEQARHELRDDGTGVEILLSAGYPGQGRRTEARLPVRGRAQGHCRDRLHGRVMIVLGVVLGVTNPT